MVDVVMIEVLCYVGPTKNYKKCTMANLATAIVGFYSDEKVVTAKQLLFAFVDSGVAIMEQTEQLLPGTAKYHFCNSHRSDEIFLSGWDGSDECVLGELHRSLSEAESYI